MTYQEIYTMLSTIDRGGSLGNIPAVMTAWPIGSVPDFPYIVFTYPENDDIIADNYNYVKRVQLNIELYTDNFDPDTAKLIEDTLDAHRLSYQKTTEWLESEKMYETLFITEVLLNA
ncbi:MAG: hypothetical protein IKE74_05875 [Mogibacterium sp.]|nr:hypothetical protein [Mogibacterium sp.]